MQGGNGNGAGLIMGGKGYNFEEHTFGSSTSFDRVAGNTGGVTTGGGGGGGGEYGVLGSTNVRTGEYKMYMPTGGTGSDSRRSSVDSNHSAGINEAQFVQRRSLIPSNAVPSSSYGQQAGLMHKATYKRSVPYGYGSGHQDHHHTASQRSPTFSGRVYQHPKAPGQGQFASRGGGGTSMNGLSGRSNRQKVVRSRSKSSGGRRPSRPRF